MAARVSQVGALVVEQGTPKDRVSQVGALVVERGTPGVRASQVGLLVVHDAAEVALPTVAARPAAQMMAM